MGIFRFARWDIAATNLPAAAVKKADEWSRVIGLQLAPEQRRSPLALIVRCAVARLKLAYDIARQVLTSYWLFFCMYLIRVF